MAWNKEDRSFKTLINKETTDSGNKFFFNEFGADTINVHAQDIWAEEIPFNDPAQTVALGRAEERTLFVLTEDLSVPNSQSWKAEEPVGTRLRDWISDKYGEDFNIRLFDGSDSEIFTTDPLGWFFDYQTGILTFNNPLSYPTPLKITGYRYVGLKGAGGAGGGGGTITTTDITIPIDFNDAGAVDPPADVVFTSQDVVDDTLTSLGATNFKYLDRAYRALPAIIDHEVTFECAAGIHRPSGDPENGFNSWLLGTKNITKNGILSVIGALSSQYLSVVGSSGSPLTIDSYSSGNDPQLSFTGTPFAGLNLRGRYVITDAGQVATIHNHDDSTLFVNDSISPTPTTCWVGRPSTIFRNSTDDAAAFTSSPITIGAAGFIGVVRIEDVSIECFGGNGIILSLGDAANIRALRVVVDDLTVYDDFAISPNGRPFQFGSATGLALFRNTCYTAPYGVPGNDQLIFTSGGNNSRLYVWACYFGESSGVALDETAITIRNSVFDTVLGTYRLAIASCRCHFMHFNNSGKINEMRNSGALLLTRTESPVWRSFGPYDNKLIVKDCIDDRCIKLTKDCIVDLSDSGSGFIDGGSNAGVGFELIGPNAYLKLDSESDLTGAVGDVKMADGSVWSYADIATYGPIVDEYGNRAEVV
jgi:hypothetical protein